MMTAIAPSAERSFKPPVSLSRAAFLTSVSDHPYDVAAGGRFVFVRGTERQVAPNLVFAVNWLEEIKARVPSN